MSEISNKCAACGSELSYDTSSGELKCGHCGSIVDIPDANAPQTKKLYSATSKTSEEEVKSNQYQCKMCGRISNVEKGTEIKNCPFCGGAEFETKTAIVAKPDGIIPFKLNQDQALECFKKWISKRRFAPNNLKRLAKTQALNGVYFPVFCYDFSVSTRYTGIGVKTHSSGSGENRHTVETRHPFDQTRNDNYVNYIDSANSTVDGDFLRKAGDFGLGGLCVYRSEYLYGWRGLGNNMDLQTVTHNTKDREETRIQNNVRSSLNVRYSRVENLRITSTFSNILYNYLYLPVYISYYSYKQKNYNCYINGYSGGVSGKFPKSFWKIFFTALGVALFIGGIVALAVIYGN